METVIIEETADVNEDDKASDVGSDDAGSDCGESVEKDGDLGLSRGRRRHVSRSHSRPDDTICFLSADSET